MKTLYCLLFILISCFYFCINPDLNKKYKEIIEKDLQDIEVIMDKSDSMEKETSDIMIYNNEDITVKAPNFLPIECEEYETKCNKICISYSSIAVIFRVELDQRANIFIREEEEGIIRTIDWDEDAIIGIIDLSPNKYYNFSIWAENRYTQNSEIIYCNIKTEKEKPTVVINEVLYNPKGKEPDQEFVELYNFGEEAIELDGWKIKDENGEDILKDVIILPYDYIIIVGENYSIENRMDPLPPLEKIVYVEGSIGGNGLKNRGEVVSLYDDKGELISWFPYSKRIEEEGSSWERVNPKLPDTSPQNWKKNKNNSSTPGKINSVYHSLE